MLRRLLPAIIGLSLTVCVSGQEATSRQRIDSIGSKLDEVGEHVMVVAHRGCWSAAPENSLLALRNCIRLGVDIVELDVRLSKDGVLMVYHDETLERMTGRPESIEDLTAKELQSIHLRQGNGDESSIVSAESIPSFLEFMEENNDRVLIDIDIKSDFDRTSQSVFEILTRRNECHLTMVPIVAKAKDLAEKQPQILRCSRLIANLREYMGPMGEVSASFEGLNPAAIAIRFSDWSYLEEGADDVAAMRSRLWVNTLSAHHAAGYTDEDALNDPDKVWGRLIDNGVSIIQTDEPAALIEYLAAKKYRVQNLALADRK